MSNIQKNYAAIVAKRKLTIQRKRDNKVVRQQTSHLKDKVNKNAFQIVLGLLAKYKDKRVLKTGLRFANSREVIEVIVKQKGLKQEEIIETCNKISHRLDDIGITGSMDLSVRSNVWYYQGSTDYGDDVHFKDEYDELVNDTFDEFSIYFSAFPNDAGGKDDSRMNNCLYDCLKSVLYQRIPWDTAVEMKAYLKLSRASKVSISLIPLIEKKLKNIAINVSGDHCYTSPIISNKTINLKLINEHYTVINKKKDIFHLRLKTSIDKERMPIIYDRKTFIAYDGEKEFLASKEYIKEIYDWKTDNILVDRKYKKVKLEDNKYRLMTMAEEYDFFFDAANALHKETKGIINLYKTGNDKTTALNSFDKYTKHIAHPPTIEQVEAQFINQASQGAIIYGEKGFKGPVVKADVRSMYPSIMKSSQCFPIAEGEVKYITQLEEKILNYGIYRCHITYDKNMTKLFRFNFKDHYTHTDLYRARELKLNIKLIVDDKPNFLYYSRDKLLVGTELFGNYVDLLFDLKQKGIDGSKSILNILWGALGECDQVKKILLNTTEYIIPD